LGNPTGNAFLGISRINERHPIKPRTQTGYLELYDQNALPPEKGAAIQIGDLSK
jgi:hypothetical protein